MHFSFTTKPYRPNKKDCVIVFLNEHTADDRQKNTLIPAPLKHLEGLIDLSGFRGKQSETIHVPLANEPTVIFAGLGDKNKMTLESLRVASSAAVSVCRDKNHRDITILAPESCSNAENRIIAIAEGFYLSNYNFNLYKKKSKDEQKPLIEKACLYSNVDIDSRSSEEIKALCLNTLLCRDLVNDTSEKHDAGRIAALAVKLRSIRNVRVKTYGRREIEKLGMGLFLAVNKGSRVPLSLVEISYTGDAKKSGKIVVVGKGITFDSGGINLKPSGHIEDMRSDMAGAAAVIYAVKAAAEIKLPLNITAIVPVTDNMLSPNSYRPGDIYKAYNGMTVEIGNTDAEGRLILADALSFAIDRHKPDYIIDIATLTGACVVTFGEISAAYLSTDEGLAKMLESSSEKTGERIWRMPFFDEYEENLKSEFADISNIPAERNAGTIMGAIFLKNFVNDARWAHIDIAGTAFLSKKRGYRPRYATGYGVRLLVEVFRMITTNRRSIQS